MECMREVIRISSFAELCSRSAAHHWRNSDYVVVPMTSLDGFDHFVCPSTFPPSSWRCWTSFWPRNSPRDDRGGIYTKNQLAKVYLPQDVMPTKFTLSPSAQNPLTKSMHKLVSSDSFLWRYRQSWLWHKPWRKYLQTGIFLNDVSCDRRQFSSWHAPLRYFEHTMT